MRLDRCDQCDEETYLSVDHNPHDNDTLCGTCLEARARMSTHEPGDCPDECWRDHHRENTPLHDMRRFMVGVT